MWISLGWQYIPLILAWTHRQNTSNKTLIGLDFPWYASLRCEMGVFPRPWIPQIYAHCLLLAFWSSNVWILSMWQFPLICSTSGVLKPTLCCGEGKHLLFFSLAMWEWPCYLESANKGLELVLTALWVYRGMQSSTPLIMTFHLDCCGKIINFLCGIL